MPEALEDLLSRLREDRTLFLSGEEATRQGAVLPILARLGWDRDNVREVVPEFSVGNGRVDYCLRVGERNAVFIEVKRTSQDLEQHQEQLLEYAFRSGVKIAVLTNGLLWWLYLPLIEGSWDQRKFFTIDIQQQEILAAVQHFRDFLGRDAVSSGSAVERGHAVLESRERDRAIKQTIPLAWKQLCQDPDEELLELLAKKVESLCGHRPDHQLLAEYLVNAISTGTGKGPSAPPGGLAQRLGLEADWTNRRPIAYAFNQGRREVSTFKDVLIRLCEDLYLAHSAEFDRVLTLQGRRRAYFSKDSRRLSRPAQIPGTGIHAETVLSANSIRDRCAELLALFGYARDRLQVEVQGG